MAGLLPTGSLRSVLGFEWLIYKHYVYWDTDVHTTDFSVNAYNKSQHGVLIICSGQHNTGNNTWAVLYFLRRGFNGNNYSISKLSSHGYMDDDSFKLTVNTAGVLCAQNVIGGRTAITIFG